MISTATTPLLSTYILSIKDHFDMGWKNFRALSLKKLHVWKAKKEAYLTVPWQNCKIFILNLTLVLHLFFFIDY